MNAVAVEGHGRIAEQKCRRCFDFQRLCSWPRRSYPCRFRRRRCWACWLAIDDVLSLANGQATGSCVIVIYGYEPQFAAAPLLARDGGNGRAPPHLIAHIDRV